MESVLCALLGVECYAKAAAKQHVKEQSDLERQEKPPPQNR